jgi:aromatic-amino-acid transaminase
MTVASAQSSLIPAARGRPGDDPIFALHHEATKRAAAGESILNATLGTLYTEDGHLAIMPSVVETLQRVQGEEVAGYAPVAGRPDFLNAVVADLFGDGPLARQAVAAATPGGTGAVFQSVINFLEPGQKLLTSSYHWGPYPSIARNSGRDFETFPMFEADKTFDVDGLAAALDRHVDTQGRALVVINDPCHNPTGYSLRQEEWRRVAEVLRTAGERAPVAVLMDVAYFRFAGKAETAWIHAIPGLLESTTVLVAWSASKSFAQYGARVGALVALHRDAEERAQIKNALAFGCRATWSNCSHLGQRAVAELLTVPELRERSRGERNELIELLGARIDAFNVGAEQIGLRMPRYDSGFFVTVFARDSQKAAARMRDLGVYVLPVAGALRVALCSTPLPEVPRLLDALEKGIAAAG